MWILVSPRLDRSLNFKLAERPRTYLLVPTGGFQDTFSSVPSSSLTLALTGRGGAGASGRRPSSGQRPPINMELFGNVFGTNS